MPLPVVFPVRLGIAVIAFAHFVMPLLAETAQPSIPAGTIVPEIDGDWWQVAGQPDLAELTGPKQQPVDFGVWQAADGTWQLWSCIRGTKAPGKNRLLFGWEGKSLTEPNWKPMGIKMK